MGLGIIRIFKAFKEITDKYEGTIKCSKRLDETLELIKNTWPNQQAKSLYRAGKFRVVKDVNWNTWHEVELQVQAQNPVTKQVIKVVETINFRVQYYQGVVNQITLDMKAVDSKATYGEFEKALQALADVKAVAAPVIKEEVLDFTDKTMVEALNAFEEAISAFGENVGAATFAKVKAVKEAISKKIKKSRAQTKGCIYGFDEQNRYFCKCYQYADVESCNGFVCCIFCWNIRFADAFRSSTNASYLLI